MREKIFKQMWFYRRQNSWIFLEMIIISFFLWKAVDPIYSLGSINSLDKGYNPDRAFLIDLTIKGSEKMKVMESLDRIMDAMMLDPMIEKTAIVNRGMNSGTSIKTTMRCKSDKTDKWVMLGWDRVHQNHAQNYLDIVEYRDVDTGLPPVIDRSIPIGGICFITKEAAAKLFPDGSNPVGQKLYVSEKVKPIVAGVIDDVMTSFGTYNPFVIHFPCSDSYNIPEAYQIIVKTKVGVDPERFKSSFVKNQMLKLSDENITVIGAESLEQVYSNARASMGVDGQIRLQCMLSFFFIACAFLGIAGTIWMKCNGRRSEIGLYRALGSTKRGVLKMFCTESATLVTIAYLIALVPLAIIILGNNHFMFTTEHFDTTIDNTSPYLYKRFLPHFAIVSLITYAILMGTAFIGTYITVHKYSNIQPSEALRDE